MREGSHAVPIDFPHFHQYSTYVRPTGRVPQLAKLVRNRKSRTRGEKRARISDKFGKNIAEEWDSDPKYKQAFDTLKQKLCSYPILRLPDLSKPYVVATDASDSGAGAALCQRIDGKLIVVEYASRAWTPAESRYTAAAGRRSQHTVRSTCGVQPGAATALQ